MLIVFSCAAFSSNSSVAITQDRSISLFNVQDLNDWYLRANNAKAAKRSKWVIGRCTIDEKDATKLSYTQLSPENPAPGQLINLAGGIDLISRRTFVDCLVEVEFMIPKGSNSGIYLMGQYEVQIIDSFGKEKLIPGDMGGIYKTAAPRVNACKKPGEWQKFVIDFRAPRFENGKKVSNARFVKVVFNDQVIHENVEPLGPTGTELQPGEISEGPIMIQGDHGPIAIRAFRVTPK